MKVPVHETTPLHPEFEKGAWFAFNEVLGWINTWNEQAIDKNSLYKAVFAMRPKSLASKMLDARLEEITP